VCWRSSVKNCLTQLGRSSAFIFCCSDGKLVQGDKQLQRRRRHRKNVVQNGATTQLTVHPLSDTHTHGFKNLTQIHTHTAVDDTAVEIFS